MTNFAHTKTAETARQRKAERIAAQLVTEGIKPLDAHALTDPEKRALERRAGVNTSSTTTWALVMQIYDAAPPRFAATRPPSCDCLVDAKGQLWEHLGRTLPDGAFIAGWPCPHNPYELADLQHRTQPEPELSELPPGVIVCTRGSQGPPSPEAARALTDMAHALADNATPAAPDDETFWA